MGTLPVGGAKIKPHTSFGCFFVKTIAVREPELQPTKIIGVNFNLFIAQLKKASRKFVD